MRPSNQKKRDSARYTSGIVTRERTVVKTTPLEATSVLTPYSLLSMVQSDAQGMEKIRVTMPTITESKKKSFARTRAATGKSRSFAVRISLILRSLRIFLRGYSAKTDPMISMDRGGVTPPTNEKVSPKMAGNCRRAKYIIRAATLQIMPGDRKLFRLKRGAGKPSCAASES